MSKSELVPQAPVRVRGTGGDCRSVPALTERVRGDGGEEGKRVSTIFFMRRKLFPLREGRFPIRSGMTRVSVKGEFKKESLPGGEGYRAGLIFTSRGGAKTIIVIRLNLPLDHAGR